MANTNPDTSTVKVIIFALTATFLGANALYMLADPLGWYGAVDGVPDTGAFNPHFVRDIGVAYLTCSLATFAALKWRTQAFTLMSVVTLFLGLHVCLHIWDIAAGRLPLDHLIRDLPGVVGPTVVTGFLVWWTRHERTTRETM